MRNRRRRSCGCWRSRVWLVLPCDALSLPRQGERYTKHGHMKAALRDVALVVSGLGSCVMTDIVDDQTHSLVRQVAVGPVTGRTTEFTLRTSGMMYKQRYKVAHTPQPMPSLEVARTIALDVARKRADTGEKLTLPKVRLTPNYSHVRWLRVNILARVAVSSAVERPARVRAAGAARVTHREGGQPTGRLHRSAVHQCRPPAAWR